MRVADADLAGCSSWLSQELGQQGALETVMDMPTLLTVDDY